MNLEDHLKESVSPETLPKYSRLGPLINKKTHNGVEYGTVPFVQ